MACGHTQLQRDQCRGCPDPDLFSTPTSPSCFGEKSTLGLTADYDWWTQQTRFFFYKRVEGEQAYLVVVNLSSQEQDLPLVNGVEEVHCQYQGRTSPRIRQVGP